MKLSMTITRKLLRAEQITTKTHSGPKRIPGSPPDIQQTRRAVPTQRILYRTYFTHLQGRCQGKWKKKFQSEFKMDNLAGHLGRMVAERKIGVCRAEKCCHCEERSDVAIPRIFRNVRKTDKRPNEPPGIVEGLPRPLKRTGLAMTVLTNVSSGMSSGTVLIDTPVRLAMKCCQ